jgi:hypothetical protein
MLDVALCDLLGRSIAVWSPAGFGSHTQINTKDSIATFARLLLLGLVIPSAWVVVFLTMDFFGLFSHRSFGQIAGHFRSMLKDLFSRK